MTTTFTTKALGPVLQALLIAPDTAMRQAIVQGTKCISIRVGHRDYQPKRPLMLCCHLEPWAVMVDVTSVRHCTLKEVTEEEYRDDGFSSPEALLEGLRRFYPAIDWSFHVTVIRWENPQGKLVDERKAVFESSDNAEQPPLL